MPGPEAVSINIPPQTPPVDHAQEGKFLGRVWKLIVNSSIVSTICRLFVALLVLLKLKNEKPSEPASLSGRIKAPTIDTSPDSVHPLVSPKIPSVVALPPSPVEPRLEGKSNLLPAPIVVPAAAPAIVPLALPEYVDVPDDGNCFIYSAMIGIWQHARHRLNDQTRLAWAPLFGQADRFKRAYNEQEKIAFMTSFAAAATAFRQEIAESLKARVAAEADPNGPLKMDIQWNGIPAFNAINQLVINDAQSVVDLLTGELAAAVGDNMRRQVQAQLDGAQANLAIQRAKAIPDGDIQAYLQRAAEPGFHCNAIQLAELCTKYEITIRLWSPYTAPQPQPGKMLPPPPPLKRFEGRDYSAQLIGEGAGRPLVNMAYVKNGKHYIYVSP